MSRISRIGRVAAVVAALALSTAGCVAGNTNTSSSAAKSSGSVPAKLADGVLTIGMSPDFPPMEFKDGANLVGLDVELANALAKELGVTVTWSENKYDQLLPSIQTDRVDIVMSGLSDNLERQKSNDFVDYFASAGVFYTQAANAAKYTKATDLCGKTVAVSSKTDYFDQIAQRSADVCIKANLPEIKRLGTDSGSAARLQLQQGRADLAAQGRENVAYINTQENNAYAIVGEPLPSTPFGIVVKKGDTQLANAMLKAMEKLQANGTYDQILAKWNLKDAKLTPQINGSKA